MLYQFAAAYAMRKPVALNVRLSRKKPRDVLELSDLCIKHNTLDLYLWLSIRFPAFFVEQDVCQEQKAFAIECIQGSLESPHLQHKFSHSNTYQTSRVKMLTGQNLGLPSLSYGEVRDSYLKNIELIDDANLYMFPTEDEENQIMGYGPATTRRFTRDRTTPSKHRDNKESRSAALPIGLRGGPPAEAYVERSHVNGRRSSSKGSQDRQINPLTGKMNTEDTSHQEKAVAAIPFKSSANIIVDKNGKKVYRAAGQPQPQPQTSNNSNVRNKKNNYSPGKSSKPSQPEKSRLKTKLASEVSSS
jgi:Mitochondrial degradasome RNA helicase subunit C terminal